MPINIARVEVQQMMAAGGRLCDVREAEAFQTEHIRGALSLPLKELDRERVAELERAQPLIAYCWDYQ